MKTIHLLTALIMSTGAFYSSGSIADAADGFECSFAITEGRQSIRTFNLTAEVYKCLKYSSHQDLVVVNAEQQIVPFRVAEPAQEHEVKTQIKELIFYPEPAASAYKTGDQIRRIAGLTGVESGNETDSQWQDKNTYYSSLILEQKKTDEVLKSLTINTKSSDIPVSATVIVESSYDLQHWTTIRSPFNILYLPGINNALRSNVLKISPGREARYLRLATLSNIEGFTDEITSVTGDYETSTYNLPPLQWSSINTLQSLEEKGAWLMTLMDLRPVSHIRFTPADNIVFYQGTLYSRPHINPVGKATEAQTRKSAKNKIKNIIKNTVHKPHVPRSSPVNPWHYTTSFTQYKINTGIDTITSADIQISPIQSKNWKLVFRQPQVADTSQLPQIELGWRPLQITFIAQGAGPFQLLAGNLKVPKKQDVPNQLLSLNKDIEAVELLSSDAQDKNETLPASKSDVPASFNLNEILLWLTLLIGVILMAKMAYQLSKKMKAGN